MDWCKYLLNIFKSISSFRLNKTLINSMSKTISTWLEVVTHTCKSGIGKLRWEGYNKAEASLVCGIKCYLKKKKKMKYFMIKKHEVLSPYH